MSRKSGESQKTSVRNCSSALCSIGPRQMTGVSSSAKKPIEMARTPWTSGGTIISSMITGARSMPSMRGIEKPQTSASTTPTLVGSPLVWRWARAMARLVVTEDLPTPPLPEAINRTRVRLPGWANGMDRPWAWPWAGVLPAVEAGSPWRWMRSASRSWSVITPNSRATVPTPMPVRASVTRRWISFRRGQPAMVRAMVSDTVSPSTTTSRTMSSSTIERCSSGSSTGRSASITAAVVTGVVLMGSWEFLG